VTLSPLLALGSALACGVCAGLMALHDNRRLRLALLAVQYAAATALTSLSIPIAVAAVKLVGGLIACSILGITLTRLPDRPGPRPGGSIPSGRLFRVTAVLLVSVAGWGLSRETWMGTLSLIGPASLGSALLMTLGLLQLGISDTPFSVGLGILTTLAGFEIAYASVEPSLAVLALLAMVHIGIALIVSYLILVVGKAQKISKPLP